MAISAWVTAAIGLGSGPYRLDLSRKASRRLGEMQLSSRRNSRAT